ncbi:MAG: sulfatase-like hydrolase/transferase, partial [Armatimonadota bacterium]
MVSESAAQRPGGTWRKPNIVYVLADDLGYGDVACLNPRGKIPTPNIDKLATEGKVFTDAHSVSAVCSPSRYGILTGRYSWRSRLQRYIVECYWKPLIPPERLTVPALLRQHGYHTACIGKWHLGWNWPEGLAGSHSTVKSDAPATPATPEQQAVWRRVFSQPITGGPTSCGFDEYFGVDMPNWPPYCWIENDRTLGIPSEMLPSRLLGNNQANIPGPALADWKLEAILPTLTDRACRYIGKRAEDGKPFFLYFSLTSPHTPLAVNDDWKGKSGLNLYADFVMETDAMVGRVLRA